MSTKPMENVEAAKAHDGVVDKKRKLDNDNRSKVAPVDSSKKRRREFKSPGGGIVVEEAATPDKSGQSPGSARKRKRCSGREDEEGSDAGDGEREEETVAPNSKRAKICSQRREIPEDKKIIAWLKDIKSGTVGEEAEAEVAAEDKDDNLGKPGPDKTSDDGGKQERKRKWAETPLAAPRVCDNSETPLYPRGKMAGATDPDVRDTCQRKFNLDPEEEEQPDNVSVAMELTCQSVADSALDKSVDQNDDDVSLSSAGGNAPLVIQVLSRQVLSRNVASSTSAAKLAPINEEVPIEAKNNTMEQPEAASGPPELKPRVAETEQQAGPETSKPEETAEAPAVVEAAEPLKQEVLPTQVERDVASTKSGSNTEPNKDEETTEQSKVSPHKPAEGVVEPRVSERITEPIHAVEITEEPKVLPAHEPAEPEPKPQVAETTKPAEASHVVEASGPHEPEKVAEPPQEEQAEPEPKPQVAETSKPAEAPHVVEAAGPLKPEKVAEPPQEEQAEPEPKPQVAETAKPAEASHVVEAVVPLKPEKIAEPPQEEKAEPEPKPRVAETTKPAEGSHVVEAAGTPKPEQVAEPPQVEKAMEPNKPEEIAEPNEAEDTTGESKVVAPHEPISVETNVMEQPEPTESEPKPKPEAAETEKPEEGPVTRKPEETTEVPQVAETAEPLEQPEVAEPPQAESVVEPSKSEDIAEPSKIEEIKTEEIKISVETNKNAVEQPEATETEPEQPNAQAAETKKPVEDPNTPKPGEAAEAPKVVEEAERFKPEEVAEPPQAERIVEPSMQEDIAETNTVEENTEEPKVSAPIKPEENSVSVTGEHQTKTHQPVRTELVTKPLKQLSPIKIGVDVATDEQDHLGGTVRTLDEALHPRYSLVQPRLTEKSADAIEPPGQKAIGTWDATEKKKNEAMEGDGIDWGTEEEANKEKPSTESEVTFADAAETAPMEGEGEGTEAEGEPKKKKKKKKRRPSNCMLQ